MEKSLLDWCCMGTELGRARVGAEEGEKEDGVDRAACVGYQMVWTRERRGRRVEKGEDGSCV